MALRDLRQAGSLWTPEEDVSLLRHVAKYGTKHWGYLQTSGTLPHRDQKACCNRFILLKRKFFQARAKGQRLTFPVVPQSEATSPNGRSVPLAVSPASHASFKGSFSSLSSKTQLQRLGSNSHVVSSKHDEEGLVPNEGFGPTAITASPLKRAAQANMSPFTGVSSDSPLPIVKTEPVRTVSGGATQAVSGGAKSVSEQEGALPALMDRPRTVRTVDSGDSALSLPRGTGRVQPAAWRCFNPTSLASLTVPDVDLPAGLPSWCTGQSAVMAPDALMDQIASAPIRMLFGNGGLSSLTGEARDDDALLQGFQASLSSQPASALNSNFDLWDLLNDSSPNGALF